MKRLRDKMYNWEAAPPGPVWDRVSAALDEGESATKFPSRLREMNQEPPAGAWAAIAASLDKEQLIETGEEETGTPVVPIRRSATQWMRYAAAILILVAAAWGIREISTDRDPVIAAVPPPAVPKLNEQPATKPTNNLPALGDHAASDSARNLLTSSTPVRRASAANDEIQFASEANQDYANELSKLDYSYEDHLPRIAEKYVTLLTPDGSFIRMSKKWSNLLCCITGEDTNAACNMQLKAWQDQLAESPVTPGPGSFMDLLDLVNSVSEGTQL